MKRPPLEVVRVIHDARDATLDTYIPLDEAKLMLREGRLFWDITNECYCTPTRGRMYNVSYRQAQ